MATLVAINPQFIGSNVGRIMARDYIYADGSATWKKGEFLRRASDGLLYEGTTGAALGVGDDAITHYALTNLDTAIGADTTKKWVGIVHEEDIYEMQCLSGAITEAYDGLQRDMDVTLNVCTVNLSSGTNPVFKVIRPTWAERDPEDDSSDTIARVLVNPLSTAVNATPTN